VWLLVPVGRLVQPELRIAFLGIGPLEPGRGRRSRGRVGPVGAAGTYSETEPDYVSNPEARKVVAAYRKAFPDVPIVDYTFAAYDCARILIDAIQRVVTANHGAFPTRAQVLAAVANTSQFLGLTGTYSFDSNGDAVSPMMSIYRVESGQWVYKQRIDAGP
jgi:branched-chain amino acid transport system substrate-binding protein